MRRVDECSNVCAQSIHPILPSVPLDPGLSLPITGEDLRQTPSKHPPMQTEPLAGSLLVSDWVTGYGSAGLSDLLKLGRLISLGLALLVWASAPVWADGMNVETWASAEVEARLAPNLGVLVTEEVRSAAGGVYYDHTDIGFSFPSGTWFDDSGVGYLKSHTKKSDGWLEEDRLYTNGNIRWRLGSLRIEDRNRVEYPLQGLPNSRWQYSNRLKLALPLRLGFAKPDLYVSDETTIQLSAKPCRVIRNRARVGLSGQVWGSLWADIFVQHQWTRKKSDTEGEQKVDMEAFGLQMKVRF